jgi:nucleotidyltransferase substrate binding protein (TIGR01987 family)
MQEKPRWIYRFDNFKRAFILLREAMDIKASRTLSQLEKEGVIQRFEYSWDLAWKTLKDFLEHEGIIISPITPSNTLKCAYEAGIIQNGDVWMRALDARNKMAHSYNFATFEAVISQIETDFIHILEQLYLDFLAKSIEFNEI